MGLNIKNEETHRLAVELAKLTGESLTAAVTQAVRERLDRIRREVGFSLADRLLAIGKDCAPRLKDHSDLPIMLICCTMSAGCRDDCRHVSANYDPSRRTGGLVLCKGN